MPSKVFLTPDSHKKHQIKILGNAIQDHRLHGRIFLHDLLDATFICGAILLEEVVGLGLCRRIGVRVIQQVLDTQQELLDGNGGAPCFLLVENREAYGARGINVGVEQWRSEFACRDTLSQRNP